MLIAVDPQRGTAAPLDGSEHIVLTIGAKGEVSMRFYNKGNLDRSFGPMTDGGLLAEIYYLLEERRVQTVDVPGSRVTS